METVYHQHAPVPSAGLRANPLWWAAPLAGLVAAALNLGIYYAATATGLLPANLREPTGGTIGPAHVALASMVPALLGALVLAALIRWADRPLQGFAIVAVGICLLSMAGPAAIPHNPASGVAVLGLMHVVAAGVVWALFSRVTRA
ncbi:DUF6069 family protein [Hymenobacter latericus]|uniref:DUF6069 family protein n=1 Tax=Hymenobacter sp. YIM 151858-1 TaxID=2987688 RepID=UPI00222772A3|nr:DUF6069 family protein [Hymenobacter sp. YIM 151858-1]UYZ58196.1 DUF6069 family protein [Hymenobacter sp. YIM 151858-1]